MASLPPGSIIQAAAVRHGGGSGVSADRAHDSRRTSMNTVATATRTLPASSQRIAPEKFAHVVLKTANYDAVIAWYATVLQARVAFRNDFIAFLTYDDEHHRVAVLNTPGSPAQDPAAAGVHHIAYTSVISSLE